MAFSKVVDAQIWGVTGQNSDVRLPAGTSAGGTFTGKAHPMKGSILWDRCTYIMKDITVHGGATGGSYNVWILTDALPGYNGLPITVATIGPNTAKSQVLGTLHFSPGSPLPTTLFIDQTAAGGSCDFSIHVLAKQYRGTLGTPGMKTSERVIQGTMIRGASHSGGYFTDGRGFTEDTTCVLGTSGTDLGMSKIRLWDTVFAWALAGLTVAGTHDVDLVATIGGSTVTIARTSTGGNINVAGESVAIVNQVYGSMPNPSQIIWTEVNPGGISDARVVIMAKTGRGSLAKN